MVKVLPEVRSGFLGVNQTNFLALLNQVGQQSQERPFLHIEVLDVAGFNECPPGQYYFRLALFSVQSIISAKNKLVWNSYIILSASNSP